MESQLLLDGIIIIVISNMLPSAFYKVAHIASNNNYVKRYKSNTFIPNSALEVTSKVIILLNIRY